MKAPGAGHLAIGVEGFFSSNSTDNTWRKVPIMSALLFGSVLLQRLRQILFFVHFFPNGHPLAPPCIEPISCSGRLLLLSLLGASSVAWDFGSEGTVLSRRVGAKLVMSPCSGILDNASMSISIDPYSPTFCLSQTSHRNITSRCT
jgi:hypothetical protein